MLEAWHSQALFTKRTTQRLREHVPLGCSLLELEKSSRVRIFLFLGPTSIWFRRASCVRDLDVTKTVQNVENSKIGS